MLEQKETNEDPLLKKISKLLKIPVEAFQNFNREQPVNVIANTFHYGSIAHATAENIQCTFNPRDKMVELNERLKEKDNIITTLEQLIGKK
ncbi:hypothetical protein [Chryseobacterium sp. ISL-6]|uniref:hypothetical protein n=1 Tax=Chryseobacterium sp. ISL-6 TaxID=2819143 RepID=UPI003335DBA7